MIITDRPIWRFGEYLGIAERELTRVGWIKPDKKGKEAVVYGKRLSGRCARIRRIRG